LWQGIAESWRHWWLILRCSAIGIGVGIKPGIGGSVAQWVAYGHAQQTSKNPQNFGKGSPEGLVAAGANNNAKDAGNLIPTLALGIPGSVSGAILLAAFLVAGLDTGQEMLTTNLDITFSMAWIMALANVIAVLGVIALGGWLSRLTAVRGAWMAPFLMIFLAVGAFTATNSWGDIAVMVAMTFVGVACIRWNWSRVPLLLGIVLGGLVERYLFLSHSLRGWDWLMDPPVVVLGVLILLTAFWCSGMAATHTGQEGDAPCGRGRFPEWGEVSGIAGRADADGRWSELAITVVLLVVFGYALVGSFDFPAESSVVPRFVTVFGMAVCLLNLGRLASQRTATRVPAAPPPAALAEVDGADVDAILEEDIVFARASLREWAVARGMGAAALRPRPDAAHHAARRTPDRRAMTVVPT
jgi:hypothetical protein